MKKSCKYCGIVDRKHICPHTKRRTDRTRTDNKVYESKAYRKARRIVLNRFDKVCLWSLFIDKQLRIATHTHHIIEILDDESLSADEDNLVPLSKYAHEEVHRLYKLNSITKKKIQDLLHKMKKSYLNDDVEPGKYKDLVKGLDTPTF